MSTIQTTKKFEYWRGSEIRKSLIDPNKYYTPYYKYHVVTFDVFKNTRRSYIYIIE